MRLGSFPYKTSLDDLPVEIIPEVASYLDLEDIYSLQQTSKKLRASINVPVVWLALAKTYSARHFHIYQPQSGRFDDLTEHELRKWIRKRLVFDRIWKAQTLQPRLRALIVERYHTIKLVPGGRWLLVGSLEGSVWYYDLDSEQPEQRVLIQPSKDIEGSRDSISGFEIYKDQDTSRIHFNLAIRTQGDLENPTQTEWLHVWQVEIKDGHSLTANWMTSVPTVHNHGFRYSLAIGRNVMMRTRDHNRDSTVMEIYWWKQCSTTGVVRSHFLAPSKCDKVYLIGDDRILCANMGGEVSLYDIPKPEYIRIDKKMEHHENNPSLEPVWSHTLPGRIRYSPLYHDGVRYRFVASTNQGIFGFTIPKTREHAPSTIQLSTFFDVLTPCIPGLYKTLCLCNVDNTGIRIGYSWESGDDGVAAMTYSGGELTGDRLFNTLQPAFDEESGRLLHRRSHKVIILDFLVTDY